MAKRIGIVGVNGRYGQWLAKFFIQKMQCQVFGIDTIENESIYSVLNKDGGYKYLPNREELIASVDVLIFSVPIEITTKVIREYASISTNESKSQLWMDVTSIKYEPVKERLRTCADVVGLHPMSAPPLSDSLRGVGLAYCPSRLEKNSDWFFKFLSATEAIPVPCSPAFHDDNMSYVQSLVHAIHLVFAKVLTNNRDSIGKLSNVTNFKTQPYELAMTVSSRILANNENVYMDIQYENERSLHILEEMESVIKNFKDCISDKTPESKQKFLKEFFEEPRTFFTSDYLSDGDNHFEFITSFLKDMSKDNVFTIQAEQDTSGQLYKYIEVLKNSGVNMTSLHSMKSKEGN